MSNPTPIFPGNILDGTLKLTGSVRSNIKRWCSTFKNGTEVDLVIRKRTQKRTDQQRKYYFGVAVKILAEHFGYDIDTMHEELKYKFNPVESKFHPGVMIGGSTTALSTEGFMGREISYVDRICQWAAMEYSIYIPPPESVE